MKDHRSIILIFVKVLIFVLSCFETPNFVCSDEYYDLSPQFIRKLDESIKDHLTTHDFDMVLNKLPDQLFFDLYKRIQDCSELSVADTINSDAYTQFKDFYSKAVEIFLFSKIHCFIMLERRSEASEFMEKLVSEHDDVSFLFLIKGIADCYTTNRQ